MFSSSLCQIENLQEQLRDKDKQLGNLKDRVKSLQTDSSNTDTALATLEEALSEKVWYSTVALGWMCWCVFPVGDVNSCCTTKSFPLSERSF